MIKSSKGVARHHLSKDKMENLRGAGQLMGKRGLRFAQKSFLDKNFVSEKYLPATYTVHVGVAPKTDTKTAVSDERFDITRFKEQNIDLAGKSVRGANRTGRLGTDFRGKKMVKYSPLAEKQFALSENSATERGGEKGRSYQNEVKPTRTMKGQGIRVGRNVPATRELEKIIDVDFAEDQFKIDLDDDKGKKVFEQIKIRSK